MLLSQVENYNTSMNQFLGEGYWQASTTCQACSVPEPWYKPRLPSTVEKVTGVSMSNTCLPRAQPANLRRGQYSRATVRAKGCLLSSLRTSSSAQADLDHKLGSVDFAELSTLRLAALESSLLHSCAAAMFPPRDELAHGLPLHHTWGAGLSWRWCSLSSIC